MSSAMTVTVTATRAATPSIDFPVTESLTVNGMRVFEISIGAGATQTFTGTWTYVQISSPAAITVTIDGQAHSVTDILAVTGTYTTVATTNPGASAVLVTGLLTE